MVRPAHHSLTLVAGIFWLMRRTVNRSSPLDYRYDLFISYARADNDRDQVTALKEQIEEDYRTFVGQELRCFFDLSDINGMEDWQHRLLGALQGSHLLRLVLSPGYLASDYCQWEVIEYLKYVHARAVGGEGGGARLFCGDPGAGQPGVHGQAAQWVRQARCYNHFNLRPCGARMSGSGWLSSKKP